MIGKSVRTASITSVSNGIVCVLAVIRELVLCAVIGKRYGADAEEFSPLPENTTGENTDIAMLAIANSL